MLQNSPDQEPHHQRASQRCLKRRSRQEFLALVGENMSSQHEKKKSLKESIEDKPETPNAVAPLISTRLQRSA